MAKVFELVSVTEMSALGGRLSTSVKEGKELTSNYVLSALKHFFKNGKKLDVLNDAITFAVSQRPRDIDTIDMAIRLLSPLKTKVDKKAKTLIVTGLPSVLLQQDKPDVKEDAIKKKIDAERAKWANVFTPFVEGADIKVSNPDFFDGVNEGKAAGDASVIPEEMEENFSQCIFAFTARIVEISAIKKDAADARLKAELEAKGEKVELKDISPDLVKKSGGYKSIIDTKIKNLLDNVTPEYMSQAKAPEVRALSEAVSAYEAELLKIQSKLAEAKDLLNQRKASLRAEQNEVVTSTLSTEELESLLAQRRAA